MAGGTCLLLNFLWGGNSFKTCSFQSGCQSHSTWGGGALERGGGVEGCSLGISEDRLEPGSGGGEWACLLEPSP